MRLSIALCAYNGAAFFQEQLNSIAEQTLAPYELIICDDGSTDETRAIASRFATSAPFPVKLQFNAANIGVVRNFQQAIELCSGDIIVLSDQDDVWRRDKLEVLARKLESYPDCGLVYSDAQLVDEKLHPLKKSLWNTFHVTRRVRADLLRGKGYAHLVKDSSLTGCTMAFRAKWRPLLFPVPEGVFLIHDGWIALVISSVSPVAACKEKLVYYRQHPGQHCGVLLGDAPSKVLTQDHYIYHIRHLKAVYERLIPLPLLPHAAKHVKQIPDKIAHIETRLQMSPKLAPRLFTALRELLTGRYHRYSNGLSSFARDVLFPLA